MKLTEWYNGDQKPVRVGVYERDYSDCSYFCWWNGRDFGKPAKSPETCKIFGMMWGTAIDQNLPWRGVQK
jgi:hypothetical protein